MMHARRFRPALLAWTLLAVLVFAAGCGDDTSGGSTTLDKNDASKADSTRLIHVDGTLALEGDTLTITPAAGGAVASMPLGPAIEAGALQALVASGSRGRVFYVDDKDPVAAKVEAAPTAEEGAKTYDGQVVSVDAGSITIDGADGTKSFDISEQDRTAFDIAHLKDHRSKSERVRIYYREQGDTRNAVAYEDA